VTPVSEARLVEVVRAARDRLSAVQGLSDARRTDLLAVIAALEARFGSAGPRGLVELEGGVGKSPGRGVPDTELGSLDVVVNPLAASFGGRALGDRASGALAARFGLPLGRSLALSVGGRADASRFSGDVPGRQGAAVEAMSARAVVGSVAFEVGRSTLRGGLPGGFDLVVGPALPPLDLVRFSSDRPLRIPVLGDFDFQVFAADLGPRQSFPHSKLFGWVVGGQPGPGTRVEIALLSKQGGQGAPEASFGERIRDIVWIGDWLWPVDGNFSDKYASLGIRSRIAGADVLGEAALTDVDRKLLRHTLRDAAAYRLGIGLPSLGTSGRHALRLEGVVTGPHVFRHQPFRTGAAVEGYPQGSDLGPDARALSLVHVFAMPSSGWRTEWTLALEERSADDWARSEFEEDALTLLEDRPEEVRVRSVASLMRDLGKGRGGARMTLGGERVRNFGFVQGASRWNWTARTGLWWSVGH
jgi:hypothetical protein